jgi:hypothetical protein
VTEASDQVTTEESKMTVIAEKVASSRVNQILVEIRRLTRMERLVLVRLVLDSVLIDEVGDEANWSAMSLEAFQRDWDNPEDAIYDNWREHYGVSTSGRESGSSGCLTGVSQ